LWAYLRQTALRRLEASNPIDHGRGRQFVASTL
jgi:hypothetical protein